jgi:uroporphyrinogen-III synthase
LGLIDDMAKGSIDAIAFTSQPQVGNLVTIAAGAGREESLRRSMDGDVIVASVGPVCSRRLTEAGFTVDVEPNHPHMGNLVLAVAEHFQEEGTGSPR